MKYLLMNKDNILGVFGLVVSGSASLNNFLKWSNDLVAFLSGIVFLGIAVTIFILNIKNIRAKNNQNKIDEMILKNNGKNNK